MDKLYHLLNSTVQFFSDFCFKAIGSIFVLLMFLSFNLTLYSQDRAMEELNSDGSWKVPPGVTEITVEAWGAGGGGGGSSFNNSGGSGGGGGGYAADTFNVEPGDFIDFTVGNGGARGAANGGDGQDGGDTNFLELTASGGQGGGGNSGNIGEGGFGEGGEVNLNGEGGSPGGDSGGDGGAGAEGGAGGDGNSDGAGGSGDTPGGGGGGGERYPGILWGLWASNHPGGDGADGAIRISYDIPKFQSEFISMDIGSHVWEVGETRTVYVTVKNVGDVAWVDGDYDANIGVKWNVDSDYPVRISADGLQPGETGVYELEVTAPQSVTTENLTFDVVIEGECWFGNNNGVCGPGNNVFISDDITIEPVTGNYYSYQSGNWNNPLTWTQDPSGSLSVNPSVPGEDDNVTILNGNDVYISDNNKNVYSLHIQDGGTLDLRTTSEHDLGFVKGEGTLRLRTNNFPSGDFSSFTSVGGGTVEYYSPSANFNLQRLQYNNLTFSLDRNNRSVILNNDLVVNGDLNINRGEFRINDNSNISRNIEVKGNVIVDNNGTIQLGRGNANHRFYVNGDFTNYGIVRFTNQSTPNYTSIPNNGRADVIFNNSTADQDLYLAGQSDFYRIEIEKGVDHTYILNIDASEPENFNLFGINNQDPGTNPPNIDNPHALGLQSGTVRLGQNIEIPSLATGTTYNVDEDAMLWLDGADVTFGVGNTGNGTTLLLYGALKVSGTSVLNDNSKQGIVSRATASIIIEDGTISTECIRPSYQEGVHRGAFNMSGGELTIRAEDLPNLTGMETYAAFTMPYPDNTIDISGGEINILSPNPNTAGGRGNPPGSGTNFSLLIGANPDNVSITGGDINVIVPEERDAYLLSSAPLWNLNIISQVNNRSAQLRAYDHNETITGIEVQPLVIKNNLTLSNNAVLTSGDDNADIIVGGDFTIQDYATYIPQSNTTVFNGYGTQLFTQNGVVTDGFNHLRLEGESDLTLNGAPIIAVREDLYLGAETTLRDNGRTLSVGGDVYNSGTHFRPETGAGRIELIGNRDQVILGDNNGVFNNLSVNKSGGSVLLSSDTRINGNLRLVSNNHFFIGDNKLSLGANSNVYSASSGTYQDFDQNKMIVTGGLMSNSGIEKEFSNTDEFLFPFGFVDGDNNYYMPASLRFTAAPSQWGVVNSRPVNDRHHLAQDNNNALTAYWKTNSFDFKNIPQGSVEHTYYYSDSFVEGEENEFIPAVYDYGTSWRILNDPNLVNQSTNVITFDGESDANGDYTAGMLSAFEDIPVLYSRKNGNWNDTDTWSSEGHTGEPSNTTPSSNTIVVIGDDENHHVVTMTNNGNQAGALFITDNSILDLRDTNGHNFAALPEETVAGSGTLRIGSGYFPRGDFGEFLGEHGGTVEYYTIDSDITIPQFTDDDIALRSYRNLMITHDDNYIVMPNRNIVVHDDLIINGVGEGGSVRTNHNNSWSEYVVNGDLVAESGLFIIMQGEPKNINVFGDLIVNEDATFRVRTSNNNTNHNLQLYGNLINNGVFNMHQNNSRVNVYFKGEADAVIDGVANSFNFYNLIVDKGRDASSVLTLKSAITTGVVNPFLTLLNGTFRVDNEELNVTVTDGSTDFSIPSSAALSVNSGAVNIAYGDGDADLFLAGKVEVLGGVMKIGDSNRNQNNSIEYAAAGRPEIFVSDGELYVNGQIRRSVTSTSGSLNYIQTGGEVVLAGMDRIASRGIFEIANDNSLLDVSGGKLVLEHPSATGTTFGDLYLRPAEYRVEGGTIQLGSNNSQSGYNYTIQSASPVWNLNIGANQGQSASLAVLPITIKNNLLINNNSHFLANGLSVHLGGDLINNNISSNRDLNEGGFQSGSSSQTTYFNGSNQSIKGVGTNVTTFANLEINSDNNLELDTNSALYIDNDLSIFSGVFKDGGNIVSVSGDLYINSEHISEYDNGGISLEGSSVQTISGSDVVIGNLLMNNSNGVNLVNNMIINGALTFNDGIIYIDDYLLTFGENANIGETTDNRRMIMLNGVLSDQGVRKLYSVESNSEFLFPLGVQGKYTPVAYTIMDNSESGSITVRPINERHPAVSDLDVNELSYYWSVNAEGFNDFEVIHNYYYNQEDVNGDENDYILGRYDYEDYVWSALDDVVDINNNKIEFSSDYITGEYTIGYPSNFDSKPILYSREDGNWNDENTWSLNPGGSVANLTPDGNPVVISDGHEVVVNKNNVNTYSIEVNGTLDIGTTLYHNMGHFFGNGNLTIASTDAGNFVLPGGRFDDFFANPESTIEFRGDNDANLPLKPGNIYKPLQNVIISGTGTKNISAEDLQINGDLFIRDGAVLDNSNYNRTIHIRGDWINENSDEGGYIPGRGTVDFNGSNTQKIVLNSTETFYNVSLNSSGLVDMKESELGSNLNVINRLELKSGVVKTYEDRLLYVLNTSSGAVVGGNLNSYIEGPLKRRVINGGSSFFPVGDSGRYGEMTLLNTQTSDANADWVVKYENDNPFPANEDNLNTPLTVVSDNEHWIVTRPEGGVANIELKWDEMSYPGITADNQNILDRLRVVQYYSDDSKWTEIGDAVDFSNETVATTSIVESDDYIFTFGLSGVTATIADYSDVEICDTGDLAYIPVSLTGTAPWSLTYSVATETGIKEFTQKGISTSDMVISLSGDDLDGYGMYEISLVAVSDALSSGLTSDGVVNLNIQRTDKPIIEGALMVGGGETRFYETNYHDGNSYSWSWNGDSGGSISSTNSSQIEIDFVDEPGIYELEVLEVTGSTGCEAYTSIMIEITDIPVPSIEPFTSNICVGTIEHYSTTPIQNNQYRWEIVGGTIKSSGAENWRSVDDGGHIVEVKWDDVGEGSITVEERVGASEVYGDAMMDIIVSPQVKEKSVFIVDDVFCNGTSTDIVIENSQEGVTYRLKNIVDQEYVGGSVPGNGADLTLSTGSLNYDDSPVTLVVEAYNLGCSIDLPLEEIVVEPAPEVSLISNVENNSFCPGSDVTFIASSGFDNYTFVVDEVMYDNGSEPEYTTNELSDGSKVYVLAANSDGCIGESFVITMNKSNTDGLWTGVEDSDLNNANNWCNNSLPLTNDWVVSSQSGNPLILQEDRSLSSLSIKAESGFILSAGCRLTINGDLEIASSGG
ncbi:hypothetical protein QA597_11835, partial [Marinilabiliaceae bacterium ANBcel2]|nr:hypothetical protein [Marinilabiliaceae bacterium ANBcel2]